MWFPPDRILVMGVWADPDLVLEGFCHGHRKGQIPTPHTRVFRPFQALFNPRKELVYEPRGRYCRVVSKNSDSGF